MKQSAELDQLAAALAAFQGEMPAIEKNEWNPFFKSKYASLASVIETASKVSAKHDLAVCQTLGALGGDTLTTMLLHGSGQFISDTVRLHLSKDDSQGHGAAITYMRRYAYMAILGLVADEDTDAQPKPAAVKPKVDAATGEISSRRREPPSQPGMVTSGPAKQQLIDAAIARGIGEAEAFRIAKDLWGDRGKASISDAELAGLVGELGPLELPSEAMFDE